MENQTIYDDDVTNNDVLLLPSAESNMKVDLGPVDLSSIVEGIEEDGDDEDLNGAAAAHLSPNTNNSSITPGKYGDHGRSRSQGQGQGHNQSHNHNTHKPSPPLSTPGKGLKAEPIGASDHTSLDDSSLEKDFLQHFGDIFSNDNDNENDNDSHNHNHNHNHNQNDHDNHNAEPPNKDNTENNMSGNDFNAAFANIMPNPLPTVQFASKGHPGNNRFYILLCMHRKEYLKALALRSTKVCDQIAQKILKNICSDSVPNGRFLECNIKSWSQNSWRNITHERNMIEIIKWALKEPPKAEVAHYFKPQAVDLRRHHADEEKESSPHSNHTFTSHTLGASLDSSPNGGPSTHHPALKIEESFLNPELNASPAKIMSLGESPELRRRSLDTFSENENDWEDGSSNHGSNSSESNHRNSSSQDTKKKKRSGKNGKRSDHKNRNGGLKRRGTISSNETTRSKSRKKINLADLRFSVSGQLSKLVEEVFAPQQQTETTCNSEDSRSLSKGGGLSSGRIKNKRKSASVSSITSSINRLRNDLVHVNFQDDNVTPGLAVAPEVNSVLTRDGTTCTIGPYDVVLTSDMKLHSADHIGNNRFRTMLQMRRRSFHNPNTNFEDETNICDEIIHQVTNGRKGKGKFIKDMGDSWVEIELADIHPLVYHFLKQCACDASLGLPSLSSTTKLLSNPLQDKKGCYKQLHGAALESLKKSKKKKAFRGLDTRSIEQLQTQMLEKRYDTN